MPPFVRNAHPDEFENAVEVLAPGDGDRRGSDCVFEHQVPADDPGDEFAHRRVRVGVGAAGDRNHRRELRVAEAGKQTADCRHQERQCHGRPRSLCDGGRGPHEDTGADDRADPERHERPSPERPLQCLLTVTPASAIRRSIDLVRNSEPATISPLSFPAALVSQDWVALRLYAMLHETLKIRATSGRARRARRRRSPMTATAAAPSGEDRRRVVERDAADRDDRYRNRPCAPPWTRTRARPPDTRCPSCASPKTGPTAR